METTNNTTMEISLKEIIAVIVRGGKKILVVALAFAILFGGISLLNQGSAAAAEQAYDAQLEEYEKAKDVLDHEIEKLNKDLENQKQYNENSQLMQIDPYNKITTTVVFAVSGIKLETVTDPFSVTETPVSYATSRIQAQYVGVWNGLDLGQIAKGTRYEGVGDKYLREVIKLENMDGGVLQLTVEGSSAAESEQIARALYAAVQQGKEMVTKASYEHELVMLNDVITKTSIDTELEKKQLENAEKYDRYEVSLAAKEAELAALAMPVFDGGRKAVIVNAILGAVAGALVAMLALVGAHFVAGRVSGAKQLTNRYGLVHFGSLTKKSGLFVKLGSRIMGEKHWSDRQQALNYISTNSVNNLPENAEVTVVSSLSCMDENAAGEIADALSAQGRKAVFVTDVAHNPEALAAIARSSGIVLAERAFVSQNAAVKELLATAKELNKPVYGFVML